MAPARMIRLTRTATRISVAITVFCAITLTTATASIGAFEAIGMSREVAEMAALDVTRLALQVAVLSIVANIILVGIVLRLATKWAQKPCILEQSDVKAALQKIASRE